MSLNNTIQLLKAAAEPTRFRLLTLCSHGPIAVNELVGILDQSQPRVSRHLKVLSDAGLIERTQNGKFVFYQVPETGDAYKKSRQLLSMVASDDSQIEADLNALVSRTPATLPEPILSQRLFNRAILDIAATSPIGALLDVGVGGGRIMKLLASHATRLVGIDNDRVARQKARRALTQAGLVNCSVMNGDMYQLPFDHGEFNTVIMDEILHASDEPVFALTEAARTLNEPGQLIIIEQIENKNSLAQIEQQLSEWILQSNLITTGLREVPGDGQLWLIVLARKQ